MKDPKTSTKTWWARMFGDEVPAPAEADAMDAVVDRMRALEAKLAERDRELASLKQARTEREDRLSATEVALGSERNERERLAKQLESNGAKAREELARIEAKLKAEKDDRQRLARALESAEKKASEEHEVLSKEIARLNASQQALLAAEAKSAGAKHAAQLGSLQKARDEAQAQIESLKADLEQAKAVAQRSTRARVTDQEALRAKMGVKVTEATKRAEELEKELERTLSRVSHLETKIADTERALAQVARVAHFTLDRWLPGTGELALRIAASELEGLAVAATMEDARRFLAIIGPAPARAPKPDPTEGLVAPETARVSNGEVVNGVYA